MFGKELIVLGHRGCSALFPENTIRSFDDCAEDFLVDGVELDVHLCKTGEVVVTHDFSLRRTAGIECNVEDLTWDELGTVDVGSFKDVKFSDARIPLLSDVFERYGKRFIYDIELKVPSGEVNRTLCGRTLELIRRFGLEKNVTVSSFNPFALRYFGHLCGYSIPRADIFCDSPSVPKLFRYGKGHFISRSSFLKPDFRQLDKSFRKTHRNLEIITWTINSLEDAHRCLDAGACGLIGNNPHLLTQLKSGGTGTV